MLTFTPAPPSCSFPRVFAFCVLGLFGGGLGVSWIPVSANSFSRWTCHVPGVREGSLPGVAIFLLPSWQGRAVDPLQAQSAETFVRVVIDVTELSRFSVVSGGWLTACSVSVGGI